MSSFSRIAVRTSAAVTIAAAGVLTVAAPAYAAAATLDVSGQSITYVAGAGQPNHILIERSGSDYLFQEVGGQTMSSTDRACWYPTPGDLTYMRCTLSGAVTLVIDVGDNSDAVLNWTDRPAYVYGGSGDDWLHLGGSTGAQSRGYGGYGNDYIATGPGNDIMDGGPGTDMASYDDTPDPVTASLLSGTGGRSYDTDTYVAMEGLTGGGAADSLTGDHGPNTLDGGEREVCGVLPNGGCLIVSGMDTLAGGQGNDTLYGRDGNDNLNGGFGDDVMWGDTGNDYLFGSDGNDALYGGQGVNTLIGGNGYDTCSQGTPTSCEA